MEREASINDVRDYVAHANMEQLDEIRKLMKIRRDGLIERLALTRLHVGQEVEFDARGKVWQGRITKVNRKTVKVSAEPIGGAHFGLQTAWNVSIQLLRFS
jgi:hypothetical protein